MTWIIRELPYFSFRRGRLLFLFWRRFGVTMLYQIRARRDFGDTLLP
jgi:hypothetical protein